MSPREQATAARLLADWLAAWKKLKAASNAGEVAKMLKQLDELQALGDRTETFVGHEESN